MGRLRHTNCSTVLISTSIYNDRANSVVVANGLVEWFQDEAADTLTSGKTRLGAVVKGKRLAILVEDAGCLSAEKR